MRAKRLKLRLFLEGREVPVVSSVVTGGMGQPATATIQVVPSDTLHGLKPRTLVHLFFLDLYPSEDDLESVHQSDESRDTQTTLAYEHLQRLGHAYKLLFVGEIVAYIFEKTQGERVFVIQCTDLTTYWDEAKQYFHTGGSNSAAQKTSAFIGSSSTSFSGGRKSAANAMVKILTQKPSTNNVDGLLGGIAHLLETIGGVFKGRGRRFRGLNDFFSAACLRLKFNQMIGISPKDTTSAKLFNHKTFKKWLRQLLAKRRNITSFREVIRLLNERIFHNYTSIPAPYYEPSNANVKVSITKPGALKVTGANRKYVKQRISALSKFISKMSNAKAKKADPAGKFSDRIDAVLKLCQDTSSASGSAKATIAKISGKVFGKAKETDKNFLTLCGFVTRAQWADRASSAIRKAKKARRLYRRGLNSRGKGTKETATGRRLDKLYATVFSPNIWFAPPPRCNVIFPEFYTDFQYRRNFLEEVTRFFLTAQKTYSTRGTDPFRSAKLPRYFAPEMDLTPENSQKFKSMSESSKKGIRFILPHEIFSGIIAKWDHMSDVSSFKSIAKQSPGQQIKGDRKKKSHKINYVQRVANYLFFLYRYGPRVITLNMPFHPYLVPGVPALVLDRYYTKTELDILDAGQLKRAASPWHSTPPIADEALLKSLAGYARANYLGLVGGLTHSISQDGGTTNVTMTHCRTHEESLEGLKGFGKAKIRYNVRTRKKKQVVEMTSYRDGRTGEVSDTETDTARKTEAEWKGKTGERIKGWKVSNIETAAHYSYRDAPGGKSTFVGEEEGPDISQHTTLVDVVDDDGNVTRIADREPLGDPGVPDGSMIIATLKKTTYDESIVKFPFEQAVFPGWMSPIYSNTNIGKDFYMQMFGQKSICDPVIVTDVDAEADTNTTENAEGASNVQTNTGIKKDDPDATGVDIGSIKEGASVAAAAAALIMTYSKLKAGNKSIDEFFQQYGYREIATLRQILGDEWKFKDLTAKTPMEPQEGEGFHSRAFGLYQDMEGFKGAGDIAAYSRERDCRQIDAKIDPRGVRRAAVDYYANSLASNKGQIG